MQGKLTLGADPELFVQQGKDFVSAHSFLSGTKWNPDRLKDGAMQVDGCAAEFNIDPCATLNEWLFRLDNVQAQLQDKLNTYNLGLKLVPQATVQFSQEYFETLPTEATLLGCEPDWCAYTKTCKVPDSSLALAPIRTSGGHIHLGYGIDDRKLHPDSEEHFDLSCDITKQLDCSLYLGSLLFDTDDERRKLYGQIGSFRPKEYGMEYRVLSSVWLSSSVLKQWCFETVHKAYDDWWGGIHYYKDIDASAFSSENSEEIKATLDKLGIKEPKL